MDDLTQRFLQFAAEKGADLVGIAPIERFDGVQPSTIPPPSSPRLGA